VTTIVGESGAFLRAAAAAESTDGVQRLHLGGQNSDAETALVSWGSALGADIDAPFTASVRWRGIVADGRSVSVGNPHVIYRNPTGGTAAVASLTLAFYREDGTMRSQTKTLESLDANDPQSIRTMVFEGLESADTYVLDIRATLQYDIGFTGEVWPGIDAIQIPYKVQEVRSA
jgi:hypothetical protein